MPSKEYIEKAWARIAPETIKEIDEGPDKIETSNIPDRFVQKQLVAAGFETRVKNEKKI